jgi:hypothetical protein
VVSLAAFCAVVWFFLAAPLAFAGYDPVTFSYALSGSNLTLRFDIIPTLQYYYILDEGTNLMDFTPQEMAYGGGTNIWGFTVTTTINQAMFWRVRQVSAADPLDTDGDGWTTSLN